MPFSKRSCVDCTVRTSSSFCSLSREALTSLQAIGTVLHLDARTPLLREGFAANRVYVLCSGRVKIMASSADGRILLLRVAVPGDVIGLAALLPGSRYKVTVETLEPVEVKSILRTDFLLFMETFSDVSHSTTLATSREYEAALLTARRLALSNSAAGKLANALLDWAHFDREISATAVDFAMPLTHEELGTMAGLSRETVTRLLGKFRKEGLVIQSGERMTLLAPQKLESLYC